MAAPPLLRTERLTRAFGSLLALDGVDVAVEEGELRAIVGPNGAGKTTFLRLISGAVEPTAGRIWFREHDVTGRSQHAIAALGVVSPVQAVSPQRSALENVRLDARGAPRAEALLAAVGLASRGHLPASQLSFGEQRRLALALALARDPVLLLLDEPTAGMTTEETDVTMDLIKALGAARTIVLTEQRMTLAMRISDRITVLHEGRVLADGTPDEIRANEAVLRTHLVA